MRYELPSPYSYKINFFVLPLSVGKTAMEKLFYTGDSIEINSAQNG
jgi:hypothetical protein